MTDRFSNTDLAHYVDHTLLKAEASLLDIQQLCREAMDLNFFAVCVNPFWISECVTQLNGSPVKIATVVGFPLGANTSISKAHESREAVALGVDEIDMVINLGAVKSGDWATVEKDISLVVTASAAKIVKVILETASLKREEIIKACQCAEAAGANFVKTSTGFGPGGATLEAVSIMKEAVGGRLKIKASGGIRDLETMEKMIAAGADRIGTSSANKFLRHEAITGGSY